jgi:hypothetical protein
MVYLVASPTALVPALYRDFHSGTMMRAIYGVAGHD